MTRHGTAGKRPGLTLIEVLVALAIFLLALGAITRLITFAGQRAVDARRTDEASRLARSKMGEVFAGVVPLSSSGETPFDEEPEYSWSMTADSGTLTGLWVVTVTVKHKADDGPGFSLQKFVPDPTILGSTQDTVTIAGANSSSSSSSSSGSSSSQSGSSQTAAGGGAMASKGKAAAKPAASGGSSMPSRGGASAAPGRGASAPSAPSSGGKK